MSRPRLMLVTGPPGSGKTTLARSMAGAIGCPVVSRDEIKEGMAHATSGYMPAVDDPLMWPTFEVFFDVSALLLDRGVSHVAEAAFQTPLWQRGLARLDGRADIRVIRCRVPAEVAAERCTKRLDDGTARAAHADREYLLAAPTFDPVTLSAPTLDVNTSGDYRPGLATIADFAAR